VHDFDDDLEPAIAARFGALAGSVAAAVPVPGAEEIIARGRRRRRNIHAALCGLAVIGVLSVATVVVGPLRLGRAPQSPADPSPGLSATPTYTPPSGARRDPVGGSIPAGFLDIESTPTAARLQPSCPGPASPFVTNASIIASAAGDGVTLILYTTSLTASTAYDEYHAEAQRCAETPAPGTTVTIEPLTFGAQGFHSVTVSGGRSTRHEAVVRYGRALLLVRDTTEFAVQRAGQLERTLCVFGVDCAARDGRPPALASLTAGEQAWAAVLAVDFGDASGSPVSLGRAVALASRMGYRTSIASVDCDEGARRALGLPAGSAPRYVPVYFRSRADAETFAARSLLAPSAIIPVHTYCIV